MLESVVIDNPFQERGGLCLVQVVVKHKVEIKNINNLFEPMMDYRSMRRLISLEAPPRMLFISTISGVLIALVRVI